jgi:hypothetical protein
MNSSLITKILRSMPIADVVERGAESKVKRLKGESEETFRTRVAYAVQAEMKEPSPKVKERMELWTNRAKLEGQC